MVKLVDAEDSKSSGLRVRVGSIPTSGTTATNAPTISGYFFLVPANLPLFSLFSYPEYVKHYQ